MVSQDEADRINSLTSHHGFRVALYIPDPEPRKLHKRPRPENIRHALSRDETSKVTDQRHKRSHSSLLSSYSQDDDMFDSPSYESVEKRSLRKRKQRITYYEEFIEDSAESNYRDIKHEKSSKSQKDTPKKHHSSSYEKQAQSLYREVPRLNRSLPKLPRDTWEYTAYRLLQSIKYLDTDKWFWYPVDPVADGVPNYPKVVHTPMDFHTITERLHLRQYTNPFGWQCDIRQIFFNAFLFYPPDNRIWQAAEHLARVFEDKLRTARYLRPDEFRALLAKGEDEMRAAILGFNEATFNRKGKWASGGINGLDGVNLIQPLEKRKAAQKNKNRYVMEEFMYNDDDDDSFNELSSAASGDEYMLPMEHTRGRPRGSKKKGPYGRMGGLHRRHISGNYTDGSDSGSRTRFTGEFVIPEVGEVPPPPPPQKMGMMERSLTQAQARTLEINLSRLASNQRKAALELVQDDLGILAEAFMNDRSFTFDPSLLSLDKQRRIFIYVNQMVKRNIEAMQMAHSRNRKAKHGKDVRMLEAKGSGISNPSEIFDASSSSSSSLSDVASNFLSSDEFFDSSDDEGVGGSNESVPKTQDGTPLPEYTPVDECKSEKAQLTRGIMGDHADFLTHLESSALSEDPAQAQQGKKSAWMEWKGQAIHHGTVAQQNGVKPRSVDEKIAESFDARI